MSADDITNDGNEETMTFEFNVSLEDLVYCGGLEGLNNILDARMTEYAGEFDRVMATDITYETVALVPDAASTITIRATFVPDRY